MKLKILYLLNQYFFTNPNKTQNMKYSIMLMYMFFLSFHLNAQNLIENEEYQISFETTELLERYVTESDLVLGYENENYAVDIEIFTFEEESEKFLNDLKYAANITAKYLGMIDIEDGGTIPHIKSAYYVLSKEDYEGYAPVYVLVILNYELRIAYEATIYCYSHDLEEGEKITKSFRLITD